MERKLSETGQERTAPNVRAATGLGKPGGDAPAIGIDLGGTKIEIAVIDAAGEILDRRRTATPKGDYDATVRAVAALAAEAEARFGAAGSIGVGIPGTISPASGLVKNANSTWLIGKPLQVDLAAALGRPVAIANDADCFALSEAIDGAGAGAEIVWGLILGTGVGSGVIVRGGIVTGPNAIGGEWGHSPLPWPADDERPGHACYCGKHGCIETFLSGPSMRRDHREHGGGDIPPADIAALAATGDPAAAATIDRYVDRLARATAAFINLLDPHVVILGGGVSNLSVLYERVPALWPRYVFSDTVETRMLPPRFGDSSGVRGAAWLGKSRREYPE